MKVYVIAGHGHVKVGYDVANHEPIGIAPITIPEGMKVAVYVPPGSEFGQKTGVALQTRVLQGGGLSTDTEINTFLTDIRGKLTKKPIEKKTTFFRYNESVLENQYPQLYDSKSKNHDLYNYIIQGPASPNDAAGFLWGAFARGTTSNSPRALVDLKTGGGSKTMEELFGLIQKDADKDVAFVSCIFCRVEVLEKSAMDSLHGSVQTNTISLYSFTVS
jgi:hypothetical protein